MRSSNIGNAVNLFFAEKIYLPLMMPGKGQQAFFAIFMMERNLPGNRD